MIMMMPAKIGGVIVRMWLTMEPCVRSFISTSLSSSAKSRKGAYDCLVIPKRGEPFDVIAIGAVVLGAFEHMDALLINFCPACYF